MYFLKMRTNHGGVCDNSDIVGFVSHMKVGTLCISEVTICKDLFHAKKLPMQGFPSSCGAVAGQYARY
jgi:hypothetical protein